MGGWPAEAQATLLGPPPAEFTDAEIPGELAGQEVGGKARKSLSGWVGGFVLVGSETWGTVSFQWFKILWFLFLFIWRYWGGPSLPWHKGGRLWQDRQTDRREHTPTGLRRPWAWHRGGVRLFRGRGREAGADVGWTSDRAVAWGPAGKGRLSEPEQRTASELHSLDEGTPEASYPSCRSL